MKNLNKFIIEKLSLNKQSKANTYSKLTLKNVFDKIEKTDEDAIYFIFHNEDGDEHFDMFIYTLNYLHQKYEFSALDPFEKRLHIGDKQTIKINNKSYPYYHLDLSKNISEIIKKIKMIYQGLSPNIEPTAYLIESAYYDENHLFQCDTNKWMKEYTFDKIYEII